MATDHLTGNSKIRLMGSDKELKLTKGLGIKI